MADPISERYKRAAALRLQQMLPSSYTPNYPDEYGVGQIMRALVGGVRPASVEPSPVIRPQSPPMASDADMAQPTMAPPSGLLAPTVQAAPVTVMANRPAAPLAPQGNDAAYVPPQPRPSAAEYGPAWNTPAAPGQYDHLNPTPSLESVFRQAYAADPRGFDKGAIGRLFGLLG